MLLVYPAWVPRPWVSAGWAPGCPSLTSSGLRRGGGYREPRCPRAGAGRAPAERFCSEAGTESRGLRALGRPRAWIPAGSRAPQAAPRSPAGLPRSLPCSRGWDRLWPVAGAGSPGVFLPSAHLSVEVAGVSGHTFFLNYRAVGEAGKRSFCF